MQSTLSNQESHLQKAHTAKILDTQDLLSGKAQLEEEKDGDIEMEEAEIPKIRRFALDKLLDELEVTDKYLKALVCQV